jgi:GNAT superfamily N-acetyltransferase
MNNDALLQQGYTISNDKSLLNIPLIHQYLSQESYWAQQIPLATVERSIQHSFCFGIYHAQQQVGFARVITDHATFAYLADVFVLPEHRGKGLSKWLMHTIHHHPQLQGLRRWMLATRDAHALYKQFGWLAPNKEQSSRLMQIVKPDIYTRP